MTQNAHVPTREPVPDILRKAARFGLEPQPGILPSGVKCLYAAIDATLEPFRRVKEQLRRSFALDANITPCAECAGERLVPTAVHHMVRVNAHLFALHDVPRSYARCLQESCLLPWRRHPGIVTEEPGQPGARRAHPPRLRRQRALFRPDPPPRSHPWHIRKIDNPR